VSRTQLEVKLSVLRRRYSLDLYIALNLLLSTVHKARVFFSYRKLSLLYLNFCEFNFCCSLALIKYFLPNYGIIFLYSGHVCGV